LMTQEVAYFFDTPSLNYKPIKKGRLITALLSLLQLLY
jgi:hypothetical protein